MHLKSLSRLYILSPATDAGLGIRTRCWVVRHAHISRCLKMLFSTLHLTSRPFMEFLVMACCPCLSNYQRFQIFGESDIVRDDQDRAGASLSSAAIPATLSKNHL